MCLAVPGIIKSIKGKTAEVQYPSETRTVLIGTDQSLKIGNYVMVQMGIITQKVSPKHAQESLQAWQSQSLLKRRKPK